MFWVSVLLSFICLLLFFGGYKKILQNWIKLRKILNKLPSIKGYPIIGNANLLFGGPEKIFKNVRGSGGLWTSTEEYLVVFWNAFLPSVNIWSPENIELITVNPIHNKKSILYKGLHTWLGLGLLTSTGEKWQHRRKILTPAFHFNILKSFLPVFIDETHELVKRLKQECGKEETDLIPLIAKFTLNSICETAMGIKLTSSDTDLKYRNAVWKMGQYVVHRIAHPWLIPDPIFVFSPTYWKQKSTAKFLHKFSRNVIEKKRKTFKKISIENIDESSYSERKRLAMLDMLLNAQAEGADIDDEGIREEVDTFMFEGHDTTSMSICFTLMLLANNRHCQDKIFEEIETILGDTGRDPTFADIQEFKYTERCIKESLRLYPSVPMISRVTGEEIVTHEGYVIPKDVTLNIFIYDMHRHPDFFPDPEKFDPDRFLPEETIKRHPFVYIPFSAGSRNCIGQKFALIELKTVIIGILRNYILEPVDTPESVVLITDLVLRPKDHIKVKFLPRKRLD